MDDQRKRLPGGADDADVRGDHQYPDEAPPNKSDDEDVLTREPGAYVAGADGTQPVKTPDSEP